MLVAVLVEKVSGLRGQDSSFASPVLYFEAVVPIYELPYQLCGHAGNLLSGLASQREMDASRRPGA